MPATGGCRHLLHVRSWSRAHLHSRAHIHWHAHGHGHIHSRVCAHPWCKPARRDQRPACTNQAPIQLTQMPCGCVTSPRIYASNRPTQNLWGAWVRHRFATRRRRRRCDDRGPEPASPPEGGPLRACTVRLTVDFDGSFALSSNGLPTNWHGKSSIEYGQCLTHTSASNLPPNRRVRQIKHRIRPVPDSHLHPTRLPTSGHVKLRQRQRRHRHGRCHGLIRGQVSQKNLRRPDAGLVGCGVNVLT